MPRPWPENVSHTRDVVAEVEKATEKARLAEQAKRNKKKSKKAAPGRGTSGQGGG